jgi:hypothetical protein
VPKHLVSELKSKVLNLSQYLQKGTLRHRELGIPALLAFLMSLTKNPGLRRIVFPDYSNPHEGPLQKVAWPDFSGTTKRPLSA